MMLVFILYEIILGVKKGNYCSGFSLILKLSKATATFTSVNKYDNLGKLLLYCRLLYCRVPVLQEFLRSRGVNFIKVTNNYTLSQVLGGSNRYMLSY